MRLRTLADWVIRRPEALGDLHYVWVAGIEREPDSLQLVLVRKRSWKESLRDLVSPGSTGDLELAMHLDLLEALEVVTDLDEVEAYEILAQVDPQTLERLMQNDGEQP